jgi:hypothetical protein
MEKVRNNDMLYSAVAKGIYFLEKENKVTCFQNERGM